MIKMMNEQLAISELNPIRARYYDYDHFTYLWHFHSQYEIIYVKQSTGLCFAGDCIEKYADGFLVLLGSNLPHYMRSDDIYLSGAHKELRVKGTIIQFEKDFMLHAINYYPQFLQIKKLLSDANRGACFSRPVSKRIGKLVEQIPQFQGIRQLTDLLLVLEEMAVSEKRLIASPLYHERFPVLGNDRIEKIISYINGNYTRAVELKEIASLAAMNPSAFCRYFKENTGKTFVQYVTDMRIGYACRLLALKEINISQISMDCGFESVGHFNRTFKRVMHLTPGQYQQHILKQ